MLGCIIKGDGFHPFDILQSITKHLRIGIRNVIHHNLRRCIGNKFLIHPLEAAARFRIIRQIVRQRVVYRNPSCGEATKNRQ